METYILLRGQRKIGSIRVDEKNSNYHFDCAFLSLLPGEEVSFYEFTEIKDMVSQREFNPTRNIRLKE